MALNADVDSLYRIKSSRVNNIYLRGLLNVNGAGSVALFTADIPFRHGLGLNVVVDGMAAITERPRRALHVIGWVIANPPVRMWCNHVRPPDLMRDVPLRAERIIIIASFREVPLFPLAAVDEGDIVFCE